MISGAHVIVYSKDAEADRAFLRDVLRFTHVDVGGGWLIFGLPPAEVAVHPSDGGGAHELYLMCEDVEEFRAEMERRGIATAAPQNLGWGVLTDVALPGGGKLGVYQPRHERPAATGDPATTKAANRAAEHKPAAGNKKAPARKPAAGRSVAKQLGAKPPAAKKPATKKPATKKSAAKKR